MDTTAETFQISAEAAEAYEAAFVPAFFEQWVPHLLDAVDVRPGRRVLDVACGTGVVARGAADRVGEHSVTGLDANEAMLAVARRVRPGITWRRGDAADLPFPDGSFDVVLCQMALMFFPDPAPAVGEMARVTSAGGTVAIDVPAALADQEAFAAFVEMVAGHASPEAANLLTAYFACGDLDRLTGLLTAAGLVEVTARTELGRYRAPSIDVAVTTEVESTPLLERIDEPTYARIRAGAHAVWRPWTSPRTVRSTPRSRRTSSAAAGARDDRRPEPGRNQRLTAAARDLRVPRVRHPQNADARSTPSEWSTCSTASGTSSPLNSLIASIRSSTELQVPSGGWPGG